MRITTWNVNGIRAAIRKGFDEVLGSVNPDVLLLQETRALREQEPKLETLGPTYALRTRAHRPEEDYMAAPHCVASA